jgi:hypothetical protein
MRQPAQIALLCEGLGEFEAVYWEKEEKEASIGSSYFYLRTCLFPHL